MRENSTYQRSKERAGKRSRDMAVMSSGDCPPEARDNNRCCSYLGSLTAMGLIGSLVNRGGAEVLNYQKQSGATI